MKRSRTLRTTAVQEKRIIKLWDENYTITDICEDLKCSYPVFATWRKKFKSVDMDNIVDILKNKHGSVDGVIISEKEKTVDAVKNSVPPVVNTVQSSPASPPPKAPEKATIRSTVPGTTYNDKDERGRFKAGHSFANLIKNPYRKNFFENTPIPEFEKLSKELKQQAAAGDVRALQLVFQCLITPEKAASPFKDLKVSTLSELNDSMGEVIQGMTTGELNLEEGQAYITTLKDKRDFIYTEQVEKRLNATDQTVRALQETVSKQNAAEKLKGK